MSDAPGRAAADADGFLRPDERPLLAAIARRRDRFGRRAATLLALAGGARQAEAGGAAGMSERQVRFWAHEFRGRRLAVFPEAVVAAAAAAPAAPETEPAAALDGPPPVPLPAKPPSAGGLDPAAPLAEAARELVAAQYRRLLAHEDGTRRSEDPEELHDMRVATRRLRAVLRLSRDAWDADTRARLGGGLRRLGRRLGAVRDLDVFDEHLAAHRASLDPAAAAGLEGLAGTLAAHRERARERLLATLDGERWAALRGDLERFVDTPGLGARSQVDDAERVRPQRVAHLLPGLVWDLWAAVVAYDGWVVPGAPLPRLHQLRIAAKSLRYALELFADVLAPVAAVSVRELRRLQDVLGALQDAVVASALLRDYLVWGDWRREARPRHPPADPVVAPAVAAWLAVRQADIERLVAEVPAAWDPVRSPAFRHRLAEALAPLSA